MRSRTLAVTGLSVAALAAAATFAGSAGASMHPGAAHFGSAPQHTTAAKGKACYSLTADDSGDGVVSANFSDAGADIYDAAGAADFTVKKSCNIGTVSTVGQYFNGAGPADSVNVLIYSAKKGKPGKVSTEQDNLKFKDAAAGSLAPTLKKAIALSKGDYWVSVVANMTFATGGEWGWNTSTDQNGAPDLWQNPGGGFGVCQKWDTVATCIAGSTGVDYEVTLAK